MSSLVALWSHLLAAALYGALALWQLRQWRAVPRSRPLVTAFAVVSVWAIFLALLGPFHYLTRLADCGRHLAFLIFMYGLTTGGDDGRERPVKAIYAVIAASIALQIVLAGLLPRFQGQPAILAALISTSQTIGLTMAAGALVLVHNVYGQAEPQSRGAIRLPMAALAVMWFYDLHLYTAGYLSRSVPTELYELRGALLAMMAGLFAFAMRQPRDFKVQLSRAATFQSLSLLAILAYLIVMMSASRAAELAGFDWMSIAQIALMVVMSAAALILVPSVKARGWASVMLQKHLFQHRYDYRQEWLRFTSTIGSAAAPIEERVAKAMADIGSAPAGLLLIRGEGDRLTPGGGWNWPEVRDFGPEDHGGLAAFLERTGHVIEFAQLDGGRAVAADGQRAAVPEVLQALEGAWAGIPLIHCGRLQALVVIAHPPLRRSLDWEDYDLFRAAGRQAASYIAEARTLEALAEARRFDEFNRRFAFILHDVKNLVSQLSLVARNAERHAGNPEFRADMVATLQSSVRKMNDLLARLAPGAKAKNGVHPRAIAVRDVLAGVVKAKGHAHPVQLGGDARLAVLADPAALEQAVSHLVQNAVDASPEGSPVAVRFGAVGSEVRIEIEDQGCGMSPDFIVGRLFQPFVSTKEGGFGIGAHEARALIEAGGGHIEVRSRPGSGTCFTIRLPRAEPSSLTQEERISA